MAVQYHVAFSAQCSGAGVIAGGPYYAAKDSVTLAVSLCSNPSLIDVNELVTITKNTAAQGSIDPVSHLSSARAWLFSGALDTVVNPGVVQKLASYYSAFLSTNNIQQVYTVPAEHSWVTTAYGNACNYLGTPYMNRCSYDAAGALLKAIDAAGGMLLPPVQATQALVSISQANYLPAGWSLKAAGLATYAYAYVSTACVNKNGCPVHIAFHGCEQSTAYVGTDFTLHTGLNEYAQANNFIVLFPQAAVNDLNPDCCWDWWGYTGTDYAAKSGVQMQTIQRMAASLQ